MRFGVDFEKMKLQPIREHELIMWTPQFVVLKNANGQEITLRKNGRMLIRKAENEEVAHEAATEVMRLVLDEFRA